MGDLRCLRSPRSSYNAAFWDREQPVFTAVRLPDWLTLDPDSGAIRGRAVTAGTYDIVFEVSVEPGRTKTISQQIRIVNR